MPILFLFILIASFVIVPEGDAAGIARRREMIMQQRQQILEQQQQQYRAQQQQAYNQAQRQAIAQQQQQVVQQQRLAYQQAMQNQMAQQQQLALNQRQQQLYAQAVQQRQFEYNQAQQYATQNRLVQQRAYNQAAMEQQALNQAIQGRVQQQRLQEFQDYNSQFAPEPEVGEVLDISDIWNELEVSSEIWPLIIDVEPKRLTIQRAIDIFKSQGIYINKSAYHYIDMIDNMATQNPNLLKSPFLDVLRFVAIIEYDFDNGISKDHLAKQILGKDAYEKNRKRLGK